MLLLPPSDWKRSSLSRKMKAGGFVPLTGQSLSRAGKISSCVNWLSAREKIGPVNEPLTSQSTCLFNRFAPLVGEVTIGRLTEQNPGPKVNAVKPRCYVNHGRLLSQRGSWINVEA